MCVSVMQCVSGCGCACVCAEVSGARCTAYRQVRYRVSGVQYQPGIRRVYVQVVCECACECVCVWLHVRVWGGER